MKFCKIFVTGGSGFIGSHLVEALLKEGSEVYVFDRIPLENAMNLKAVCGHHNLHYKEGNICDKESLRAFFPKDAGAVFHLASVVGVKNYLADPLALIDTVVGGTRILLELARERGTRLIFSSTSEIYGKNPSIPWDETGDRVLGPTSIDRWSYSTSKAVCEHMLYGVHRQCGLPFSIVRFFNVYGPRQNSYYVVSQSIYRALRGEPPLCYDNGEQTRCFSYIEDIVRGLIEVSRNPKAVGEAFNLGDPQETTIRQIIEIIMEEVGGDLKCIPFNTDKEYGATYEDIPRRVPKVTKAQELLGWRAEVPLREGIRRTIQWAKENPWWLADRPGEISKGEIIYGKK